MFRPPTLDDFERMLGRLLAESAQAAAYERMLVQSEATKAGISGRMFFEMARRTEPLHRDALRRAGQLAVELAGRGLKLDDLGRIAQGRLAAFERELVDPIETAASRFQVPVNEIRAAFAARTADTMRDLEIGFVGGRAVEPPDVQTNAFRLLQAIESESAGDVPTFAVDVGKRIGMPEPEAIAAFGYLKDKNLIRSYAVPYTASVSAYGHDILREARAAPERPTAPFPNTTFNVINNYGAGAQIQQATHGSTQSRGLEADVVPAIQAALELLARDRARIADPAVRNELGADIDTVAAQLRKAEPDRFIVRTVLTTIRDLVVTVTGNAITPATIDAVNQLLSRLG
jgi:hypothetical protein